MKFLKEIIKNTIKGILSFFLGLFIIIIFFSIISALFSGEKEEVITVKKIHYFTLIILALSMIGTQSHLN